MLVEKGYLFFFPPKQENMRTKEKKKLFSLTHCKPHHQKRRLLKIVSTARLRFI